MYIITLMKLVEKNAMGMPCLKTIERNMLQYLYI